LLRSIAELRVFDGIAQRGGGVQKKNNVKMINLFIGNMPIRNIFHFIKFFLY
jgi:hypothetical protein